MLQFSPKNFIDERDISYEFIHASGPGGQNVNKVASAVKLRFNVENSHSLPDEVKKRLIKLAGKRFAKNGFLIIEAKRFRTQDKNLTDATQRLYSLLEKALLQPKTRHPTNPSNTARIKRLATKKQRGAIKRLRRVREDEIND